MDTQLCKSLGLQSQLMNPLRCRIRPSLSFATGRFKSLICSLAVNQVQELTDAPISEVQKSRSKIVPKEGEVSKTNGRSTVKDRVRAKFTDAQLKQNWVDALSCPFPEDVAIMDGNVGGSEPSFVIGIDPDVSGAMAVLRADESGLTAQVFDAPFVPVLVGKKTRKRLDAKSIVQLIQSLDAPLGTVAYLEQSTPYPQDGKQGWWGGGFGYGLWIGVLVASGFSVVTVPSAVWKNKLELSGNRSSKDDSRLLASKLFPSLSDHLKRKKDHGRAEALLIAAYGKGLKVESDSPIPTEDDSKFLERGHVRWLSNVGSVGPKWVKPSPLRIQVVSRHPCHVIINVIREGVRWCFVFHMFLFHLPISHSYLVGNKVFTNKSSS